MRTAVARSWFGFGMREKKLLNANLEQAQSLPYTWPEFYNLTIGLGQALGLYHKAEAFQWSSSF